MNRIVSIIVLGLVACGGYDPESSDVGQPESADLDCRPVRVIGCTAPIGANWDDKACFHVPAECSDQARSDIGQSQQELLAGHRGGTAQFGTRTDVDGTMCDTLTSSQSCIVPKNPNIKFFMTTPSSGPCVASANRIAQVRDKVNGWFNETLGPGSGWTISQASTINDPGLTLVVEVNDGVSCGNGFCPATSTDRIAEYGCITGSLSSLIADPGFTGTPKVYSNIPVLHIDQQQISLRTAGNNTRYFNLLRWVVYNSMHRLNGVGSFAPGNLRCASNPISNGNLDNACSISSTETCILESFSEFPDQTHFGLHAFNCGT